VRVIASGQRPRGDLAASRGGIGSGAPHSRNDLTSAIIFAA
jgi:hypothetical protein